MASVNQRLATIRLRQLLGSDEGWGRRQGRTIYSRLLEFVEANPTQLIVRISLEGIRRLDMSFASESIVEIARRYRGQRGFVLTDVGNEDILENLDAAAERKQQPIIVRVDSGSRILGSQPSAGTEVALQFAVERGRVRASEFAKAARGMTIQNASTKFKQLWQQGFLLRQEESADSGGIEFVYLAIA